jgi:hypothetical protein
LHGSDSRWILGAIDAELAKDSAESTTTTTAALRLAGTAASHTAATLVGNNKMQTRVPEEETHLV